MNRKEKRAASKRLGIMQFQQKLSRKQKFNLMYENVIAGKKAEKEFEENVRQQINSQIEEKESQIILSFAENIAKRKNIPVIDAMKEAQIEYQKMGTK